MSDQEKPKSLGEALLRFQQLALKITKDQKADTAPGKYRYLSLEKLLDEVLAHLSDLELVWTACPTVLDDGVTPGLAYELHFVGNESGPDEKIWSKMPLMLRGGTPQDQGAAISYARRYSMLAVLNLAPDVDEDGQISTQQPGGRKGVKKLTKAKAQQLIAEAEQAGVGDKLRLAASHAHKADIGEDLEKGLVTLSQAEGEQVSIWIRKKAQEALQ